MRRPIGIAQHFRRFLSDTSGSPTVEFVIVFPMLIWVVFSTFEIGWITTRQVMLERGLNQTIRDLRLGRIASPTHAGLKTLVCERSLILRDCETSIHIELIDMSLNTGLPQASVQCVDRTGVIDPILNFSNGIEEDIMFIRVCVIVDPLMPGMGIGTHLIKDASGGFAMVAFSAFKQEP